MKLRALIYFNVPKERRPPQAGQRGQKSIHSIFRNFVIVTVNSLCSHTRDDRGAHILTHEQMSASINSGKETRRNKLVLDGMLECNLDIAHANMQPAKLAENDVANADADALQLSVGSK